MSLPVLPLECEPPLIEPEEPLDPAPLALEPVDPAPLALDPVDPAPDEPVDPAPDEPVEPAPEPPLAELPELPPLIPLMPPPLEDESSFPVTCTRWLTSLARSPELPDRR